MWIQEPIDYDKHAVWGVSHWGRKCQQFYSFAVNRESARDVYSKRKIIVVTELKIVEWHSYKHLDWITMRRDDDKLYKFKEGNFKRLPIQDIEDMLLLLVQGKLTYLTVEERFDFNVSLRMFTRSIVIHRRVEDLQLGVKRNQKKLNQTKPDSYRSNLKRKEAYTAYSNPRGFIYQNKDKKNRLMRIDERHKFTDGMLTDVRTALDDRLKGIRMRYLPQTIWKKSDKDRAAAMIQAIDKRLKTRRIMRSLERLLEEGYTRETSGCCKGPYDLSYAAPIFQEMEILLEPTSNKLMVDNPYHVYKLKKALYELKQALRAWYDMLSSFLISQYFSKGSVDPTPFIRRNGNELLLVQIYVDDIIFAASTPELCEIFAKIMFLKFKMSMMGKILFFLGLQISQSPRGIFINQSKYALESLKKYGFKSCDPVNTPMVEKSKLDEDKEGKSVDPSHYRGMIGTIPYLTASRPDLQFAICMCAWYQTRPTEKHLHAIFDELPFEEEILAFLRYLGYSGEIKKITDVNINKLHQPWRSFAAVINKCLSGKSTGYDSLWLSQAQILWGMYHKKNVDFAYLLWEDFVYQVEHKDANKSNEMYYPRNSIAYKEYYAIASGAAPPKTKASVRKTQSSSDTTITPPTAAGTRLSTLAKGKQPAKSSNAKGLSVLSEVAMTEAEQIKLAIKRSLQQTHISQASGSGADEGTGILPGVPDVPTDESDEEISWKSNDQDDDDQEDDDQDDNNNDQDSDNDGDDLVHPKVSTHDEESKDEESFDSIVQTPSHDEKSDDEGNDDVSIGMNVGGDEGPDAEDDDDELHRYLHINMEEFVGVILIYFEHYPSPDVGIDSLFEPTPWVDVQITTTAAPLPLTSSTIYSYHFSIQQAPTPTPATSTLHDLPYFSSLFRYIDHRMNEAVKVVIQIQFDRLRDEPQAENEDFLNKLDENIQKIIKEQVKELVKTSFVVVADLSELKLKKILIEKLESNKSIHQSDEQRNLYKALVDAYECDKIILDTYGDTVTLKRRHDDVDKDKEPSVGSDQGSKRRREGKEPESTSAPKEKASKTTVNLLKGPNLIKRLQATFLMNRLKVDTLTPELLAGPTYELMKGSCKSLVELKFFLEEVYKATIDQLDWNNPEGHQYPHNLLKPLPLIPNSRGRHVIPFDHFINNDLEYLRGGASSRKYTTSVTKTKAADYGHIKWIKDLVPRTMWSQAPIVEWHSYKHLDWITVRRDDDKLYKFKEGDFKRLCIQDIEDKLLLLVQGKLTNLTVEECFAVNISLRIDITLNDARTALDDHLKGIRMKYLPQTIWRKTDKERAAAIIQAIDKQLKTRRIMRSLEKFVGGRLYEGDFRMLQWAI
nr:retrovirus-related Pol polyprotein from transposon TNT 1-94 [Tanacetum cinerariifolium]